MTPRVQNLSMSRIVQELIQAGKAAPNAAVDCETPDAEMDAEMDADNDASNGVETAGSRRRRTRNGFTPLTESEKRVKQRQLVKRSYYRKIVRHPRTFPTLSLSL